MIDFLNKEYTRDEFTKFIRGFLPEDTLLHDNIKQYQISNNDSITAAYDIGKCASLGELKVIEIHHEHSNDARVKLVTEAFRLMAQTLTHRALVAFVNPDKDEWRLSLMTLNFDYDPKTHKVVEKPSNPRRYSYLLGVQAKTKTPHQYLIEKGRVSNASELQDRFSVEVVNKDFYDSIAILFTKLVGGERGNSKYPGVLKIQGVTNQGSDHQEFAVRLIGRIIFSWFLKEKKSVAGVPIIPDDLLSLSAVRASVEYYHNILEPLFFELLNKRTRDRHEAHRQEPFSMVPYLNGGLFSDQPGDYYRQNVYTGGGSLGVVDIPDEWFAELFTVLEQYNFTVDENTSYDVDLSIDPEMLGRIFENLLAEINPETGESARKSTGSFYTPREIVDYMVDGSLLEYLRAKTGIDEIKLKALISWGRQDDQEHPLTDDEKRLIVDFLAILTILDPACGSGAFPIGILQKVVYILQQVDDKAELWFAKQIASIPSPEFRHELEDKLSKENYDYIRKLGVIRESIFGVDIQSIATEIAKLRCFLTLIIEEEVNDSKDNRGIHPLPNLDFKFVAANSLIGLPAEPSGGKQTALLEDVSHIDQLKTIREEYFTADQGQRETLRNEFDRLQKRMFMTTIDKFKGTVSARYSNLSRWEPFENKTTEWFDAEWMFGVTAFDIVIANPPYVDYRKISDESVKNTYKIAKHSKMINLYTYFYELGLDSIKEGGVLCFISPQQYLVSDNCKGLRDLIRNYTLVSLSDYSMANVFTAGTYPFVTLISKVGTSRPAVFREYDQIQNPSIYVRELTIPNPISEPVDISEFGDILHKMSESDQSLKDIVESIFVASSTTQRRLPLSVGRYKFVEASNVMRNRLDNIVYSVDRTDLYSENSLERQKGLVIYTSRMTDVIRAAIVDNTEIEFLGGKVNVVRPNDNAEYVVSLLNSKAVNFWFRQRFGMTHMQGGALPINASDLKKIPVPRATREQQQEVARLFNNQQYEEVDMCIYGLYGLTPVQINKIEATRST